MNTKLTLTIDRSVIDKAKKYARGKQRSLSDLVENYLKTLTVEETANKQELSSTLRTLKGSFKMPDNADYKEELTERLSEKYLK